jgi:hypothetical protein
MSGVTRHKESECPSCTNKIDAAQATEDPSHTPSPNDLSLCAYCGTWNKFAEDLSLIPLEEGEMEHLPADLIIEMEKLSNNIKAMIKLKKQKDEN